MRRLLPLLSLLAVPVAAPAQAPAAVDYAKDASWLCLPGRGDSCSTPLRTVELETTGYGKRSTSPVAKDPGVDCFIAYPTVSRDQGMNSDLNPGLGEEKAITAAQFARFASVCRPFAPIYRSMTVGAVAASAAGADVTGPARLAYGDVRAAWRQYLATRNHGRPFVLIGHSQGSLMLIELLKNEIEGRPEAKRMKLAIVPGFNVLVPLGKRVGGTFKSTPLCSRAGQTGCVLAWSSYRERNIPPPGALFGFADQPGMTVACTNPAGPGAAGWLPLDSFWEADAGYSVPGGPIVWSSEGAPPAPFLHTKGLVSARCVNDGPRGYLSIRTNADPADPRTDRVGGEVGLLGFFLPGWGMHLSDVVAAQGDLVRLVGSASPSPADPLAPR